VVHYRSFRNDDPPRLADVWNEALAGRGAVKLRHCSPLDNYLLAKPYFDRNGLIVAEEEGTCLGFGHAGFGPNAAETALSYETGITCLLAVRPKYQHRGIGTELLRRCEAYLTAAGARSLFAGAMRPLSPFYLGLYGGSDLPGFLGSDAAAQPFLIRNGYRVHETNYVFHRQLTKPVTVADGRFAAIRRQYDVVVAPLTGIASWWQECVLGPLELIEFRLEDQQTRQVAARVRAWEMEGFSWRWNLPAVGLVDIWVRPELRRQALAKFLLWRILLYLQEQYFLLTEVQAVQSNAAAIGLYQGLGFEQVDTGRVYQKA
jgi:ribosomal protein S18 acetylase RimI-like enzyme